MYKKKSKLPIIAAILALIVLVGITIGIEYLAGNLRAGEPETEAPTETELQAESGSETEASLHNIILYKTGAASIEFDSSWLVSDTETESVLEVEADTLVTMLVTPAEGKLLAEASVVDYDFNAVDTLLSTVTEGSDETRLSFVMPDRDVIINMDFTDAQPETDIQTEPETDAQTEAEPQSEAATEQGSPYGLTLHGVTADVITAYNGMFDDTAFLQAIGAALHVDSARSEYRTVTDVYISPEDTGLAAADKVYYYVYFNGDENWRVLSTYYMDEDSYVFTEIEPETETAAAETQAPSANQGGTSGQASANQGTSGTGTTSTTTTTTGGTAGSAGTTTTTTTSFDILSVSTVFLAYVGDQDAFYQAAFDYVLGQGLTGEITGTMSDYSIDPDAQTAEIRISLNTGGTITGTYDKGSNTYRFTGL